MRYCSCSAIVKLAMDLPALHPYHAAAILDLKRGWTGINNVRALSFFLSLGKFCKIDLCHYLSICHYCREVCNGDHSPLGQFLCPCTNPKWRLHVKGVSQPLSAILSVLQYRKAVLTWCKSSLESLVCGSGIAVAAKMYPDHVSSAVNFPRWISATLWSRMDRAKNAFNSYWKAWIVEVRLSDLQIVVLAMLALFQFKRLKLDPDLMSFWCEKIPLPIEIRRVPLRAKFWSADLATRYI